MATKAQLLAFRARLVSAGEHDDVVFPRLIEAAMKVMGLTVRDLSDAFGVSRPEIDRWRQGRDLPSAMKRKAIFAQLAEEARAMPCTEK